jgi:protein involved in polysaccharide export with SLBB domain
MNKRSFLLITCLLMLALCLPVLSRSQEVRLRPGDRVELTVPQRSELDRRLVIDDRGRVSLPIIGEVEIGGMSITEAENVLLRELREVYPSVQRIAVILLGEEARRVIYVHGEVEEPGKYSFEKNPTLWEAIREAGGATSAASLETVRIIRAESTGERTMIFDLQAAIESGDLDGLPVLQPGDAVIVPESTVMRATTGSVRVIGAVTTAGPYMLTGDKTLVDAILAAGGPTATARLDRVNIVRTMPDGGLMTIKVDFARYLENGDIRHNPLILPGDTVNVPSENRALAVLKSPTFWLAAITAYGAVYAIVNR